MTRVRWSILAALFAAGAAVAETTSERGARLYERHCAACHSRDLRGSAHGAPLVGPSFLAAWGMREATELLTYTRHNMPPRNAAALSTADHAAIVAFLLERNRAAGADGPLMAGIAAVEELAAEGASEAWESAAAIDAIARSKGGFQNRPLETFRPVSEAELAHPEPGDWLHWRRTWNGWGYSPLAQINRRNVRRLHLAWSIVMRPGSNQGTPLVRDGVMFLTHPDNVIQALDAASGELIWEYRYPYPDDARKLGGPTRNIALFGERLFLATYDAALVAVDARTGEELWRAEKADYRQGYTHSAGPVVAGGVVVSGINGCERFTGQGCFITGHDPETGRELWRLSTIAAPGQPGGDTWGGQPAELRAGGDTWIAGSYDPDLDLFYIGTSQAKPWVASSRGMTVDDEALYTNATLALRPRTGELVWYFQHVPGETLDMETGFERVLVDRDGQRLLLTVGKDGLLWKLDRRTGAFLQVADLLGQDLFAAIDPASGRVTYREDIRGAKLGDPMRVCPGIYGGHNWQATAYDPHRTLLVVPLHGLCSQMVGRPVELAPGGGGYGGVSSTWIDPRTEGNSGILTARRIEDLAEVWTHRQRALILTGVLTTAGGLAFVGDLDRYFKAFDLDTGEVLWQTRLPAPPHGYPISFSAGGRQFIAVQTGIGVFRAMTAELFPEIHQPTGGEALFVFALSE
ncbi:MAG: pyrrolo-quinoline quinone [Porticoccaceae bacterium]|nr:MAG: pyrrolo-quinoline quinone [Porticoccaceae bacterium]